MHIISRKLWRGLGAAALLCAAGGVQAATSIYAPFSQLNNSRTQWTGLWLADVANPGNAPFQITNQPLDGSAVNSSAVGVAVLNTWSTQAGAATGVQAAMVVYGVGGRLYKANLQPLPLIQPFSSGSYAELCSLTSLDPQSFSGSTSYVQAVVEPVGSTNTCATGLGTQTWLIPAYASALDAPTIEPANWSVLGAFTDTSGNFNRWIVWNGNAVATYQENFTGPNTILSNAPAGPAPQVLGRQSAYAILLFPSDSSGVHTDTLYQINLLGGGLVGHLSYSDTGPCASQGYSYGVVADSATRELLISEPTDTGYAVYRVGVGGGPITNVYADASGSICAGVAGNDTSGGYVALDAFNPTTGANTVISVREGGPVTQTPVAIAGSSTDLAEVFYTINGHFWILMVDDSTAVFSTLVANGDGTLLQDYGGARMDYDLWGGFFPIGMPPITRPFVYLFSAADSDGCAGGSLTAVSTSTFATTGLGGLPADTCALGAYGWSPASVGYVQEPAGSSPIEINPVNGEMYVLPGLGPVLGSYFYNVDSTASGYPFF